MGAGAAGWAWLQIIVTAGSLAGIFAIFLHYADKPGQVEQWVEKDPEYRAEKAAELRGARIGATYRDYLTRGLDWLDRNWGQARSARALGICIIIALCYAWAAFFLAWGIGGPGHIGGTRLGDGSIEGGVKLLGEMVHPGRGLLALWLIVVLPLGFALGRFVGLQEGRLKVRLRRRRRWRRRRFEIGYRAALVILFGAALSGLALIDVAFAGAAGFGALYAIGPIAGVVAARRCGRDFSAGVVAATAGVVAAAVPLAAAFWVAAVAWEVARALAVAVVGAFALAGAVALAGAGAFAGAFAGAVAGAVAAAIGAATVRRSHRGAFAGGIGLLAGFGIGVGVWVLPFGGLADEAVVVLIIFFLVLPVVNGFWDWLSWWITRGLGRHLLTSFGAARGLGERGIAVLGHGALDLVLAAALMAAMAFLLAFGFEVYNRIAFAQGTQAFDLGPFLGNAADRPWSDGLWLTVMLLSTLVPTALHMVALLASPLALVTLPTERRLKLARELASYDRQPDRQASIQRRAGRYFARERHLAVALAAGLFVVLIAGLLALINLGLGFLEEGQTVAHLVLRVAEWGIAAAWILG